MFADQFVLDSCAVVLMDKLSNSTTSDQGVSNWLHNETDFVVCTRVTEYGINYFLYSRLDRLFLFCFLPIVVVIGVIGNIFIIVLILKEKKLRSSPNMYLLALAVSDIIYLLSENIRGWLQYSTSSLQADSSGVGLRLSKLLLFTRSSSMLSSCFIMIAVSFDRYFCICKPMRSLTTTKKSTIKICIAIWVVTALYNSQMFFTAVLVPKCLVWPAEEEYVSYPKTISHLFSCEPKKQFCMDKLSNSTTSDQGVSNWLHNETDLDVCTRVEEYGINYYLYSRLDRLFLFCFLPIVVVIGVIGNIFIIVLILKEKKLRSSPNMYLLALAVSDIIYLLSENIRGWLQYSTSSLQADSSGVGLRLSKLLLFTRSSSILSSCFIMIAVSFDRYFCICKPMRSLTTTKKTTIKICIAIWVVTALYNIRIFFSAVLVPECLVWPAEEEYVSYPKTISHLFSCEPKKQFCVIAFVTEQLLVLIVIPVTITLYILMVIELRRVGRNRISQRSARVALKTKKRTIKMLMTIVVIYAFCIAPFRLLNLIEELPNVKIPGDILWIIYYVSRLSANLNSAVNPIVYGLISQQFRKAMKTCCRPYNCSKPGLKRG
ncbi:neuromedin-U receptor 2-like [Anneissia japonica]|uniref:neuromedin-U receptor 2-like n=1 Tax=Anneissia japonica TaxID=1529436 RepID=UPI0014257C9B|nr:neuromedin-U receptor 2-like [Anneissia japonica]